VRTAQDNAREFGQITRQGYGLHVAFLAACSVRLDGEPDAGDGKMALGAWSREAGVPARVVVEAVRKWDRMAEAGWDCDRSRYRPQDVDTDEPTAKFVEAFERLTEGRSLTRHVGPAKIAEAIRTDPQIAAVAMDALREREAKTERERFRPSAGGQRAIDQIRGTNAAALGIAKPVQEAAQLLAHVQDVWEQHAGSLSPGEQKQVKRSLRDIRVMSESLEASLELDQMQGVTKR
jgi:hypothetical protein